MANSIIIRNLKHIKRLEFEVPGKGVYLLSGRNGSGKSTVLACLMRIKNSHAFAKHFIRSYHSSGLDDFTGAEVIYRVNDMEVVYTYGGKRWVPRPRSKRKLLDNFGYPEVFYIGATADRITPRTEDFLVRRTKDADPEIVLTANTILGTEKFSGLKTVNLTTGAGNSVFVLECKGEGGIKYFSEKNFSLGELCVLKLVKHLQKCVGKSLVLIDELELALHPRAQIELLRYLVEIAEKKELTVIFSTHSVSLLKNVKRQQIIFLDSNEGIVEMVKNCYPTYVLGNITFDEEPTPDGVIYVEDEAARWLCEALLRLWANVVFEEKAALTPVVKVIPVGPFMNTARMLSGSQGVFPCSTVLMAVLDEDVKNESVRGWEESKNYERLGEFADYNERIKYLPCTPEVGLVDYLSRDIAGANRSLKDFFGGHKELVSRLDFKDMSTMSEKGKRDTCKSTLRDIFQRIGADYNVGNERVQSIFYEILAEWLFCDKKDDVMKLFSVLNRKSR
ncbi:ATP-dependent nuclease [Chitinimonas lacunae]|uniref:ATP-dependent endonuclease n=1 Tax=Chitinimonas lacunae TaxID=1963018 RepID=A0ABV8MNP6_9NEIS